MARSSKLNAKNKQEVVETPVTDEIVTNDAVDESTTDTQSFDDSIKDVNIDAVKRSRFRINGDNNKIVELDIGDIGISYRLAEAYGRLNEMMVEVGKMLEDTPDDIENDMSDDEFLTLTDKLKDIDDKMRSEIDYIFNYPVADVCANGSSMYKPYHGMFVYEHIIDILTALYSSNLNSEFSLMRKRVDDKIAQYRQPKSPTKKYHR